MRIHALRAQAVAGLQALPGVSCWRPMPPRRRWCRSWPATCIRTTLARCWTSAALPCVPAATAPSYDHLGLGPTTRASFALYNTPEEVQRLIAGVAHALEVLQ